MESFRYSISVILFILFLLFDPIANQRIIKLSENKTGINIINRLKLKKLSPHLEENSIIEELLFPENNFRCGSVVNFTVKYGFIKNPEYPNEYKVPVFCQWNIIGKPDEIITISIDELDIENPKELSLSCMDDPNSKECCTQNYLKLSSWSNEQYFCGKLTKEKTSVYISKSNMVSVTFNATTNRNKAPGFYFSYFITSKFSHTCYNNEFRCNNGKCIPKKWTCNQKHECEDDSDELLCDIFSDTVPCGDDTTQHYRLTKRCDGHPDCKNMADELDCDFCDSDHFRCATMKKCINNTLLCNGIPDCQDFSDETAIECRQFCPPNRVRCGNMAHCYDPRSQRCNSILDCPNGADELNCHCKGKIMCANGDGCYGLEERCNGIVQCGDYSDEKNCTLELCRPDKGTFLCTNGRCIPSLWACDRSADCFDASDEMQCLKNSVITAAIIGCLICGLLLVFAISCGCKLVALRHHHTLEQYRAAAISNSSAGYPTHFRNMEHYSFPNPGDLDASLFRMQHPIMFREPPPSYASAMGGYPDINSANHSYMEQYRRYRRQRRCRRMMRRQHRNQPPGSGSELVDAGMTIINNHHHSSGSDSSPNETTIALTSTGANNTAEVTYFPLDNRRRRDDDDESKKEVQTTNNNSSPDNSGHEIATTIMMSPPYPPASTDTNNSRHNHPLETGSSSSRHICTVHVAAPPPPSSPPSPAPDSSVSSPSVSLSSSPSPQISPTTPGDNLNIELEPIIPPLTNFDCDSQPLIR